MPSSGQVKKWRWEDPEWEPDRFGHGDPEDFVDAPMSDFQLDFLERGDEPFVILQTGVGAGKTRVAAWQIVLKMLDGWRILAIAQTSKALKMVLYRDVLKILMTVLPDYDPGKYYNKTEGHIGMPPEFGEACCDGGTDENPSGILGLTEYDGVVIDEASRIKAETRNNAMDRNRGKGIRPWERDLSSPNADQPEPWFAEECKKHPDRVIHATSLDNAFTTEEYKRSLKDRYGEGTPLYNQQVLGLIIDADGSDSVFHRADLELALNIDAPVLTRGLYCAIGVDCARFGNDNTQVFIRYGYWMGEEPITLHGRDSYEIADAVEKLYKQAVSRRIPVQRINVDMAYGSGVIDVLRHRGHRNVCEVPFGGGAEDSEHYLNVRAELFFRMQKWLLDGGIIRDEELAEEMRVQRYQIVKEQKFKLVDKDVIREILGRSPDKADAAALTFYGGGPKADLVHVDVERAMEDVTGGRRLKKKKCARKFARMG
ncbi:MAG: terminase family protein [Fibrobacter sp.]|nr:terminase family protein [Fibrobacter sp.]